MEEGECFSCDKCNFQTTTQGQLEKHIINRHVTFSCDICNFEAAKKHDLRDHLRFEHYGLTYNCEFCAKKFNGKMFLKRHMFKMHGSQLSRCKQCGVKYLESFKKHKCKNIAFACNGCDKVFKRKDRAKEHARCHEGRTFDCSICGIKCSRPDSLRNHIKSFHSDDKHVFICCGKTFKRADKLKHHTKTAHILKNHEGRDSECNQSEPKFKDGQKVKKHLKWRNKKSLHCIPCDKNFATKRDINSHKNSFHDKEDCSYSKDNGVFTCNQCGDIFTRKARAEEHIRWHRGLTYDCPICGTKCKRKDALKTHIESFHSDKVYQCFNCEDSFKRKDKLKEHMRAKHNIRLSEVYSCGKCDQVFSEGEKLGNHIATDHLHNELTCNVCSQPFLSSSALEEHYQSSDHKNNVDLQKFLLSYFPCTKCDESLENENDLRSHLNEKHGVKHVVKEKDNEKHGAKPLLLHKSEGPGVRVIRRDDLNKSNDPNKSDDHNKSEDPNKSNDPNKSEDPNKSDDLNKSEDLSMSENMLGKEEERSKSPLEEGEVVTKSPIKVDLWINQQSTRGMDEDLQKVKLSKIANQILDQKHSSGNLQEKSHQKILQEDNSSMNSTHISFQSDTGNDDEKDTSLQKIPQEDNGRNSTEVHLYFQNDTSKDNEKFDTSRLKYTNIKDHTEIKHNYNGKEEIEHKRINNVFEARVRKILLTKMPSSKNCDKKSELKKDFVKELNKKKHLVTFKQSGKEVGNPLKKSIHLIVEDNHMAENISLQKPITLEKGVSGADLAHSGRSGEPKAKSKLRDVAVLSKRDSEQSNRKDPLDQSATAISNMPTNISQLNQLSLKGDVVEIVEAEQILTKDNSDIARTGGKNTRPFVFEEPVVSLNNRHPIQNLTQKQTLKNPVVSFNNLQPAQQEQGKNTNQFHHQSLQDENETILGNSRHELIISRKSEQKTCLKLSNVNLKTIFLPGNGKSFGSGGKKEKRPKNEEFLDQFRQKISLIESTLTGGDLKEFRKLVKKGVLNKNLKKDLSDFIISLKEKNNREYYKAGNVITLD